MLRTSDTHPLQIAAVDAGADRGKVGVTFAPGKNDRFATGGPWARDLDKDLDAIVAWGARTIVTLLESHELAHLAITRLGMEVQGRGIEWLRLPIPDVSTPDPEFEAEWPAISDHRRSRLDAGENILIHCRGGLGRSGLIAARLLAESGVDAEEPVARVRAVRPGAIETWEQAQWARSGHDGRGFDDGPCGLSPRRGTKSRGQLLSSAH
jgi:protein-tyrosine phosphatase